MEDEEPDDVDESKRKSRTKVEFGENKSETKTFWHKSHHIIEHARVPQQLQIAFSSTLRFTFRADDVLLMCTLRVRILVACKFWPSEEQRLQQLQDFLLKLTFGLPEVVWFSISRDIYMVKSLSSESVGILLSHLSLSLRFPSHSAHLVVCDLIRTILFLNFIGAFYSTISHRSANIFFPRFFALADSFVLSQKDFSCRRHIYLVDAICFNVYNKIHFYLKPFKIKREKKRTRMGPASVPEYQRKRESCSWLCTCNWGVSWSILLQRAQRYVCVCVPPTMWMKRAKANTVDGRG